METNQLELGPLYAKGRINNEYYVNLKKEISELAAGQAAGSGPCPSGHSHNYCVGWRDGVSGVTEDYDCENPNQPPGVAGCPNDK